MLSWLTTSLRHHQPQLVTGNNILLVRWYRFRMRVSKRFKLAGCRFVPTTYNTWRVVTSKIPRRFYRERERGPKELKAHRMMKEQLLAKQERLAAAAAAIETKD